MDKTQGIDTQVSHFEGADHLLKRKAKKKLVASPTLGSNPDVAIVMSANGTMTPVKKVGKKKKAKGFKKVLKKVGSGIKKGTKGVAKGVKKGVKAVGKVAKGAALLPLLVPIVPVMQKALKAKGVKPVKGVQKLAEQFYTVVVKKQSHFASDHFLPLAAIVPPIIDFVKNAIGKKKAGIKPSDPAEKAVADSGEQVLEKLETKAVIEGVKEEQINAASSAPGSNIKVPDEMPDNSGVAEPAQKRKAEQKKRKKAKDGSKNAAISFSNPLVIGGAIAALIVVVLITRG
jgi:hypothetical protein